MNHHKKHGAPGNQIPDWKCERYLLGELSEAEMQEIQRAAQSDRALRARLEAIEDSNRQILQQYPPGWINKQVGDRLKSRTPAGDVLSASRDSDRWFGLPRTAMLPTGLLALLLIVVLVLPARIPLGDAPTPVTTRLKGASQQLHVYRKTASGSQQLVDGDRALEHDQIRLQYQTNEPGFGAILSLDARGEVTRHLPEEGTDAVRLATPGAQFLDYAYELDDAPHWEVFVFATSPLPFAISTLEQALQKSLPDQSLRSSPAGPLDAPDRLELPEGFQASIFTLIKDSRDE